MLSHQQCRIKSLGGSRQAQRFGSHDLADGAFQAEGFGGGFATQVAHGEDACEPLAVQDGNTADLFVVHQAHRGAQRRLRAAGDGAAADEPGQIHIEGIRLPQRGGRLRARLLMQLAQ